MSDGLYLWADEAAAYLGYTADRYEKPVHAFMCLARRHGRFLPRVYVGRKVQFLKSDLDRFRSRVPATAIRLVPGRAS